jgi:hypothetical protein
MLRLARNMRHNQPIVGLDFVHLLDADECAVLFGVSSLVKFHLLGGALAHLISFLKLATIANTAIISLSAKKEKHFLYQRYQGVSLILHNISSLAA